MPSAEGPPRLEPVLESHGAPAEKGWENVLVDVRAHTGARPQLSKWRARRAGQGTGAARRYNERSTHGVDERSTAAAMGPTLGRTGSMGSEPSSHRDLDES